MASNRNSGWSKWIVILLILGAAGVGDAYFNHDHSQAPQYLTAPVTRGELIHQVGTGVKPQPAGEAAASGGQSPFGGRMRFR